MLRGHSGTLFIPSLFIYINDFIFLLVFHVFLIYIFDVTWIKSLMWWFSPLCRRLDCVLPSKLHMLKFQSRSPILQSRTTFGDRIFTEVIKGLLEYCHWCPYKKRKFGHRYVQREDNGKTQGEDRPLEPGRSLEQILPSWSSEGTNSTVPLILELLASRTVGK